MSVSRRPAWEDGFTLVEMMVVLLVLGILVSIALASFVFSVSASKESVCKANLRIVRESIEMYRSVQEDYPPDLDALVPEYLKSGDCLYCPISGDRYEYDPSTGEVNCPYHKDY